MAQENQSGMKGKLGHVGETIKEKVHEAGAHLGFAKEKGKAEMQETMDKVKHPTNKEAHKEADLKESEHKHGAAARKEAEIAKGRTGSAMEHTKQDWQSH